MQYKKFNIKICYVLTVDGITRGEGTPQRPRKQLDLPVLPSMMQQRNQDGGEIESKLQEEIMKMNGILSINGKVRTIKCTITVTLVSLIYLSFWRYVLISSYMCFVIILFPFTFVMCYAWLVLCFNIFSVSCTRFLGSRLNAFCQLSHEFHVFGCNSSFVSCFHFLAFTPNKNVRVLRSFVPELQMV